MYNGTCIHCVYIQVHCTLYMYSSVIGIVLRVYSFAFNFTVIIDPLPPLLSLPPS